MLYVKMLSCRLSSVAPYDECPLVEGHLGFSAEICTPCRQAIVHGGILVRVEA